MRFWTVLSVLLGAVAALPLEDLINRREAGEIFEKRATCSTRTRREWRMLSSAQKRKFTQAIVCMTKLPSKGNTAMAPGIRHRYDDFNAVHIIKSDGLITSTGGVHLVGQFFHWHRYFVWTFETALREECGWNEGIPYWNWSLDALFPIPLQNWDIWNPDTGFGGNGPYVAEQNVTYSWPYLAGQTGGGCVLNGPFKNVTHNVGPGLTLTHNPHCLRRGLNPDTVQYLKPWKILNALLAPNFVEFDSRAQGPQDIVPEESIRQFHTSGHYIAGGDASDYISSATEPLFWLHHAFMDKIYYTWQMLYPSKRLQEVGGVTLPFQPNSPPTTLNTPIDLLWEAPTVPISKLMDISGAKYNSVLCYRYL